MQSPPSAPHSAFAAEASVAEALGRIRALIQQQQFDAALAAAIALSAAAPEHRDVLYLVAVCQRLLRRLPAALASLEALEKRYPEYSLLLQERGYCLVNLGQSAAAITAFARAVLHNPALLASWDMLERLHRAAGDGVQAATAAEQAAALRRLPSEAIRAASLYWDGDLAAAEATLQPHIAAPDANPEALLLLARIRWKQGELDAAEALYSAQLERQPARRDARQERARLNLERRDCLAALADIDVLRLDDPDNAFLRMLQAGAWAGLGHHDLAIVAYRALLDAHPAQAEWRLLLGHSLKAAGRRPEAIAAYRAAASARPAFGDAWWSLANLKTWQFAPDDITQMRVLEEAATTTGNGSCATPARWN